MLFRLASAQVLGHPVYPQFTFTFYQSVFINSFSFLLKKRKKKKTNGCNLVQVFVNIKNKY